MSDHPTHSPSSTDSSVLLYGHGICMTLAWAFFASAGIFLARFKKNEMPIWWMRYHIIAFVSVLILTVIGFLFALAHHNWILHITNPHTLLGLIIFLSIFLQPILGIIADRMFKPNRTGPPIFPDQVHWYVGRVLHIIGLFNIYLGLELIEAHFAVKTINFIWVGFLISVFVFKKQPKDKHAAAPVLTSSSNSLQETFVDEIDTQYHKTN